jgi:hypothetical protein
VAIDQARPTGAALDAEVAALGGATRIPLAHGWGTFAIAGRSRETLAVGPVLPIASVRANRHAGDVGRMLDGNVGSGWGSGESQDGHEELVIDLGAARPMAAIVFEMGSFAFGFPRQLDVDVSVDGSEWHRARSGGTALLTIRGALADPSRVPVTIGFDPVAARFIRLRQTGQEPDIPWWIAELEVRGPA